jgi:hypothetical protein
VRTSYVLIDYESVQPSSMTALEQECIKVIIFVGEKQTKVASSLLHHCSSWVQGSPM